MQEPMARQYELKTKCRQVRLLNDPARPESQ